MSVLLVVWHCIESRWMCWGCLWKALLHVHVAWSSRTILQAGESFHSSVNCQKPLKCTNCFAGNKWPNLVVTWIWFGFRQANFAFLPDLSCVLTWSWVFVSLWCTTQKRSHSELDVATWKDCFIALRLLINEFAWVGCQPFLWCTSGFAFSSPLAGSLMCAR